MGLSPLRFGCLVPLSTEVERYAVWPGQACAYMVGREEMNRRRDKARAALGPRFDLRSFHDLLLANGSTPLTVMGRLVDQWLVAQDGEASGAGGGATSSGEPEAIALLVMAVSVHNRLYINCKDRKIIRRPRVKARGMPYGCGDVGASRSPLPIHQAC